MTTTTTVSRKDAERALAAVRHQFKDYLAPMTIGGRKYSPACPEPTLVQDYDDAPWAILWEEGPDDWAHRATSGGTSEEERVLVAEANAEFGGNATVKPDEPVVFPTSVYAEPYYSFVLCLYPA